MKLIVALLTVLLTASVGEAATFSVQWAPGPVSADNANAPTGFKVYRNGALIGQTIPTVTTLDDTGVTDPGGASECYTVSAFNSAGESAQSAPACAQVPIVVVVPNAPGTVVVTIKIQ